MPVRGIYFQLCLVACCSPHPSWQCLWFLCEFPCPGHLEGPKEHPLGLVVLEQGFIAKQALFRHLLAQSPLSPQKLQVLLLLSCGQEVDWPFRKHRTREWASLQVKEEGSALVSLACVAGGHLPTPLASWCQVSVRSQYQHR